MYLVLNFCQYPCVRKLSSRDCIAKNKFFSKIVFQIYSQAHESGDTCLCLTSEALRGKDTSALSK